jgi:hypothetical protein
LTTGPSSQATEDPFDRLIKAMPRITEAVNAFTSEQVQRSAFDVLVRALGIDRIDESVPAMAPSPPAAADAPPVDEAGQNSVATSGVRSRTSRGRSKNKRSYTIPKHLNFAPDGQPSLEDFVAEKSPRNMDERNLAACYYLSDVMGIDSVDVGHVLAVYQAAGWRAPAQPDTSLQLTASKLSWLDTHDMRTIKVVWQGLNHLKSKMPVKQDKKAA